MKPKSINLPTQIQKRDGRKVKFDSQKITQAIFKAFQATRELGDEKQNLDEAKRLTPIAVELFTHTINGKIPTVETMQDVIENVLMAGGYYQTAKAYIIYRAEHEGEREAKEITGVEDDLGLTLNQLKVIESRYLRHDEDGNPTETPRQLFARVAKAIAGNEKTDKKTWEQKFTDIMANFEFVPSGGYLRSAGTKNPMLANCFVLPIEDSMTGIFDSVKWMALIHQKGGGTGFNFSSLRPKGDLVNTSGGFSSGPISFMKVFDAATRQVMQGGFKRGANMGILNVDHPDILDFITCKTEEDEITNFNISVGISDKFMQAVKADKDFDLINPRNGEIVQTLSARNLYSQIITLAWRTGDPGVIFLDAINRNNPLLEKLGPMITTNPCITGDTLISTEEGMVPLKLLKNKNLKVATDQRVISKNPEVKHFPISAFYNQGKKQVFRLTTKSGYELKATNDHKIMTTKGFIKLKDLNLNDQILLQSQTSGFNKSENLPFKSENKNLPQSWSKSLGQVLGWLVGDGWLRNGDKNCRIGFTFFQDDLDILNLLKPLINQIYGKNIRQIKRENNVFHLSYHSQFFVDFFQKLGVKAVKAEKKEVPNSLFTAPKSSIVGFLQALFSADGTIGLDNKKGNYYARLTFKSEKLLKQVQLLLLNFGIRSNIYNRSREPRQTFSYKNKKGEEKKYESDGILFELNISKINLKTFISEIGFLENKHKDKIAKIQNIKFKSEDFTDQISKIEKLGLKEVFDITEDVTHSFIAGGIVVSNCGEQPLHPFDVCNLGSINLSNFYQKFDNPVDSASVSRGRRPFYRKENNRVDRNSPVGFINWKRLDEVIRLAVRFLDNGVDVSTYPIPQVTEMAGKNRRIGLGVMGWADLLFKLEIPYNSQKASDLASKISHFIYSVSHNESEKLAEEKGVFPNWEGSSYEKKGIKQRNLAITTIAPTGTISMVANCSSGIEPVFLLSFTKNVVDDAGLYYINPIFEKALETEIEDENLRQEIIKKVAKTGTCQNIEELPDKIKKVFVTAHDINWQDHVIMQASFQSYTDNAVSKTINFPHDASLSQIEKAYMMAWEAGCKGLTIYRDGSKSVQILEVHKDKKKNPQNGTKTSKTIIQSKIKLKSLKVRMEENKKQETGNLKQKEKNPKNLQPNNLLPAGATALQAGKPDSCPECGSPLQASEGCSTCLNCGYSKCSL